jgi:hypothetical protein
MALTPGREVAPPPPPGMPPRKRKRPSHPTSPAAPPTVTAGRARAEQPEEEPTLVPVEGAWSVLMSEQRQHGLFLDATLDVGGVQIKAHRAVLAVHSAYIKALFTSGMAESEVSSNEPVVIQGVDGAAVAAIVACMYTGELSLHGGTVCAVIQAANMLQVGACEKVAGAFFAERLEPSTALDALEFAEPLAAGTHGLQLKTQVLAYLHENFSKCAAEPAFLKLPCERVAELISSDRLRVYEDVVLCAVRTWLEHDEDSRKGALEVGILEEKISAIDTSPYRVGSYHGRASRRLLAWIRSEPGASQQQPSASAASRRRTADRGALIRSCIFPTTC